MIHINEDVIKVDSKTQKKRQKLANKIVAEHFEMTLHINRDINYLWYMYYKGAKVNTYRPFIFGYELNLLVSLNTITPEEKNNMDTMLSSEDSDNVYMAILAIDNFRKQRIKIHGEWKSIDVVSETFIEIANKYHELIINLTNKL